MYPIRSAPGIRFEPFAASSPRLSLDFLPANACFECSLADSHLGLVLLRKASAFLVCDPVSRRHTLLPPLPASVTTDDGIFFGSAIISRAGSRFELDAVIVTIQAGHPRPWVASVRHNGCRWRALPLSENVEITFDPFWLEQRCVHAAGSIYWHICGAHSELAMDTATMEFST